MIWVVASKKKGRTLALNHFWRKGCRTSRKRGWIISLIIIIIFSSVAIVLCYSSYIDDVIRSMPLTSVCCWAPARQNPRRRWRRAAAASQARKQSRPATSNHTPTVQETWKLRLSLGLSMCRVLNHIDNLRWY